MLPEDYEEFDDILGDGWDQSLEHLLQCIQLKELCKINHALYDIIHFLVLILLFLCEYDILPFLLAYHPHAITVIVIAIIIMIVIHSIIISIISSISIIIGVIRGRFRERDGGGVGGEGVESGEMGGRGGRRKRGRGRERAKGRRERLSIIIQFHISDHTEI